MKKHIKEYFLILLGAFVLAFGVQAVLLPQRLSTGGISTVGTVLDFFFSIPLSATTAALNLILFLFGFRLLGKKTVVKTVFGIIFFSLFLQVFSYLPEYKGDVLVSCVAGGVISGIGIGTVLRQGASTGGSDFLGLMLNRIMPHISIARIMLVTDCIIVIGAGIAFRSIDVTVYSLMALFITAKVSDMILVLGERQETVQVFSPKNEEIADIIMEKLERGATGLYSRGMYLKKDAIMLLCVVSPKEMPKLIEIIKEVDGNAFVIINEAHRVLGQGFDKF